jgi:hypothetical protein
MVAMRCGVAQHGKDAWGGWALVLPAVDGSAELASSCIRMAA